MIRVLVVDDSLFMRKTLKRMLEKYGDIVVETAENGKVALEKIGELKPDVITLDIEMPVMDGIETLKNIMARDPLPVIMVSALTREGASLTIEALSLGAIDFITKDSSYLPSNFFNKENELVAKIKSIAKKKVKFIENGKKENIPEVTYLEGDTKFKVLSIGASTGGPPVIQHIVTSLPKGFPIPVLIAQHMPKLFTLSFAKRLNGLSQIEVKEAEDKEPIKPGIAYIAPGSKNMKIKRFLKDMVIHIDEGENYIYKPSVDSLFLSCADLFESGTMGVILTGMGNDGLVGARELKRKKGVLIAQNEETCVVYGMPKVVVNENLADFVLPVQEIPKTIMRIPYE